MANALYPKWREALISGAANSGLNGTVKCALVDTGVYTYSAAHQFLTDLTGRVGTDQTLALLRAVATHDVGEMGAGDLPGPFKRANPHLARLHAEAEAEIRAAVFGADQWLTPEEACWLALVDGLDAHIWCLHRAPAEYDRPAAGWGVGEASLRDLARDLGCAARVVAMLHDLRDGTW